MKLRLWGVAAVFGFLWVVAPAAAHHSVQAQFDLKKPFSLTGTVTKVEWINPHSYLYLDVKDDSGTVKHWAFEMAGPGALRRAGLSRADRGGLKPGDTITVNGVLAKDGTDSGLIKELKFSDGRVFTIWAGDPNAR
jgi:DNA/RNA endonuclease YhcR with UshA esterase domain